jgi:hypothetical protein
MSLIATRKQIVCLSIQIRKWSEAHSAAQRKSRTVHVCHHGGLARTMTMVTTTTITEEEANLPDPRDSS